MGLIISVVPKGSFEVLKLIPTPQQTFFKNFAGTVKWANSNLNEVPDRERDCKVYFEKIYKLIPKKTDYYFVVDQLINKETEQVVESNCRVLGPGSSVVDAYSTSLIFSPLSTPPLSRQVFPILKKDGYFVKGTKDENGELEFGRTADAYELNIRSAHVSSREKLKKMTLQIPTDQQAIPEELQTTKFWTNITQTYSVQLRERHALDRMIDLNQQYAKAETAFYNNLKLYREYKDFNARLNSSYAVVSLMLQAGYIAASAIASNKNTALKSQMDQMKENQEAFGKELNSLDKERQSFQQKVENLDRQHKEYLRRNHIPITNVPRIQLYE